MFWGVDMKSVQPDDPRSLLLEWRKGCAIRKRRIDPTVCLERLQLQRAISSKTLKLFYTKTALYQ
jgi:hypothetical protein